MHKKRYACLRIGNNSKISYEVAWEYERECLNEEGRKQSLEKGKRFGVMPTGDRSLGGSTFAITVYENIKPKLHGCKRLTTLCLEGRDALLLNVHFCLQT